MRNHANKARELGLKTVSVACGLFLHGIVRRGVSSATLIPSRLFLTYSFVQQIGGIDIKSRKFTTVGSPDIPITFTAEQDIASSIVRLAVLAVQNPPAVPGYARVNGDTKSWSEMAQIVEEATGDKVEVTSVSREEWKTDDPLGKLA